LLCERDFVIAGAVNQAGFKEDRLEQNFLPQPLNGFEEVFQTAKGPKTPSRSPSRAPDLEADPRPRESYARESGKKDPPPREDSAGSEHKDVLTKASASARPVQKHSEDEPPSPTKQAEAVDVPAKALERSEEEHDPAEPTVRTSMMAQTGAAAYRLSPHGGAEQQFAETAGAIPLGESLAPGKSLGGEAGKLENTVLFAKPEATAEAPVQANLEKGSGLQVGDTKLLTPVDILNLSRETAEAEPQFGESLKSEAELELAQARNEVMMRLGKQAAGGTQGSPGQPATPAAPAVTVPGFLMAGRPLDINPAGAGVLQRAEEEGAIPSLLPTTGAARAVTALGEDATASRAEQIIDRIVQQARWVIRNNRTEVTFRLQPEHLGEVHLKVIQADGQVRVDMTVDNLGVKQLVESRINDLQNRLQDQQLASGQFEFNVDVRQGDGFRQAHDFALSTAPTRRETTGLTTDAEDSAGALARSRPIWGRTGSGIYA
jgi:flagellar hook-length control protein FliK